jgi:hypothetical protein
VPGHVKVGIERHVLAAQKEIRGRTPLPEQRGRHPQLDTSILPVAEQVSDNLDSVLSFIDRPPGIEERLQPVEARLTCSIVDGAPIVRVHQIQIPEFGSLIEIRDAW